jgi:hypothetical protein
MGYGQGIDEALRRRLMLLPIFYECSDLRNLRCV